MKRQLSFAGYERSQHQRATRRETFLAEMDRIIPWAQFVAVIEPHYFAGGRGRPPVGIEPMLRMYFVQCWFNLSDESTEEAIYDSLAVRDFVGIDLGRRNAPDATTYWSEPLVLDRIRSRHLMRFSDFLFWILV